MTRFCQYLGAGNKEPEWKQHLTHRLRFLTPSREPPKAKAGELALVLGQLGPEEERAGG